MATTDEAVAVDGDKLMQFVFRAVDEVGATLNAALVVMGDKLGLYRALAGAGPLSPGELADRTGTAERYVREWLNAQAAGGYVEYDPDSGRYVPELGVRRLGLPRRLDRDGAQSCRGGGCGRASPLRGGAGGRLQRNPVRPGHDVRLPARHGRPRRRGAARALDAEARRNLD